MRLANSLVSILPCLLLAACASSGAADPGDVQKNIKWSVIFGVTPDANGVLQKCRYVHSSDPHSSSPAPAPFTPSDAYVKNGCDVLANGNWNVTRDADGNIKEVYMFCFYSTAVPDDPVCNERYSKPRTKP
jgi:hypothetical protein